MVALTGRHEAYYTDYWGTPQEFISAFKWGYLYQGQRYTWQQRRGTPAFGLKPATFVTFFQNHDQIANSGRGLRCHLLTSPGRYKALTAVLLLGPATPMLFQGKSSRPQARFFISPISQRHSPGWCARGVPHPSHNFAAWTTLRCRQACLTLKTPHVRALEARPL